MGFGVACEYDCVRIYDNHNLFDWISNTQVLGISLLLLLHVDKGMVSVQKQTKQTTKNNNKTKANSDPYCFFL